MSLEHRNYTFEVYPSVSVSYYQNISYNGLPKTHVDFFDFEHYEPFDELEKNVVFEEVVQEDYNDELSSNSNSRESTNDLTCSALNKFSELLNYIKN